MEDPEAQDLNIYEVINRTTGERSVHVSLNSQDACQQAGWLIGDCYVNVQKPRYRPTSRGKSEAMVKIPCRTCPFQYSSCNLEQGKPCPIKPEAPELKEWLKQASQAHLCPHQGQELTKKDHNLQQKCISLTQAIAELSPKTAVNS